MTLVSSADSAEGNTKKKKKKTGAPSHRRQPMPYMDVSPFRRRLYGIRKGWHVRPAATVLSAKGQMRRDGCPISFDQCTDSVKSTLLYRYRILSAAPSTFFSPPAPANS